MRNPAPAQSSSTYSANLKPETPLVPLRGWVSAFYVTVKGQPIGPYYARRWKENGKLHKQYIKHADVERVRSQCEANRQLRKKQLALNKDFRTFKGNFNYYFRILKRADKGKVTPEHYDHMRSLAFGDFFCPGRPALRKTWVSTITDQIPSSPNLTPSSQNPRTDGFSATEQPCNRQLSNFMVPPAANRKCKFTNKWWKKFKFDFMIEFNAHRPLSKEEKLEAQAQDLKKHILASAKQNRNILKAIKQQSLRQATGVPC